MTLKEKLILTGLFLENEYLENYINLVEQNYKTIKQKNKTQVHHIIPKVAYKLYNWEGVDDKTNLVNLLYKDHILAHYYLALAAKQNEFKYRMVAAINFILGKATQIKLDTNFLKDFTLNLDKYQELYEIYSIEKGKITHNALLGHETSEETRNKISKANKNRIYVHKNGIARSIHLDEVQLFLENGWILGNPNCQKRRQLTGKILVHKEDTEKYILKDELDFYLASGWIQGMSDAHKKSAQYSAQTYYDGLTKEEKIIKCATRLGQHWKISEQTKEKISLANKGRVQSEEQKLLNSLNKKDTIWMTDGKQDVMIKKEFELEYIANGFVRGRTFYKKKK